MSFESGLVDGGNRILAAFALGFPVDGCCLVLEVVVELDFETLHVDGHY